ncbi:hypothetical protein BCR44DRAFT_1433478 [Catenaria anguillulae PL171]|uniref:Uncharacterized protein n=1 Tax=Catenaria anguillulae PL171 TaxID=765915 RepID=A0A1Y2HRI3_9FUNG|nr:hypothetical protein BCR44DRAFT_1433478 [Catenaria anguillulae PL171]
MQKTCPTQCSGGASMTLMPMTMTMRMTMTRATCDSPFGHSCCLTSFPRTIGLLVRLPCHATCSTRESVQRLRKSRSMCREQRTCIGRFSMWDWQATRKAWRTAQMCRGRGRSWTSSLRSRATARVFTMAGGQPVCQMHVADSRLYLDAIPWMCLACIATGTRRAAKEKSPSPIPCTTVPSDWI